MGKNEKGDEEGENGVKRWDRYCENKAQWRAAGDGFGAGRSRGGRFGSTWAHGRAPGITYTFRCHYRYHTTYTSL